jgi:hypothetical protein
MPVLGCKKQGKFTDEQKNYNYHSLLPKYI